MEEVHSDLRGCGLDMDADKGFLEGGMPELRSERFVITREGKGKGWQRNIPGRGDSQCLSPVAEGPQQSKAVRVAEAATG